MTGFEGLIVTTIKIAVGFIVVVGLGIGINFYFGEHGGSEGGNPNGGIMRKLGK